MATKPNTPQPAKWSDIDRYLKPAHLAGKTVTVIIERIQFETLHPRPNVEEIKPVAYFKNKSKGLILTATNQDYLREVFGDSIAECFGQAVQLRAEVVRVAGKDLDTIRMSKPGNPPPTTAAPKKSKAQDAALWEEEGEPF